MSTSAERGELMHQTAGGRSKTKTPVLACGAVQESGPFIMDATLKIDL